MGIDVYLKWEGMTKEDEEAQVTGWSTRAGHLGYLRESYDGEPYATAVLVPEAFGDTIDIEETLHNMTEFTRKMTEFIKKSGDKVNPEAVQAEAERLGASVNVYKVRPDKEKVKVKDLTGEDMKNVEKDGPTSASKPKKKKVTPKDWPVETGPPSTGVVIPAVLMEMRLLDTIKACILRQIKVYRAANFDEVQAEAESFVDFVMLAKQKEAETGKPCRVIASY